jgi:hypothetical protein
MEGNLPYLKRSLEKKRTEQQERANKGGPNEVGALDWNESLQVAAYATFYAAEDLLKSSEKVKTLTIVLIVLTAILAVLTLFLATR